MRRSKRYRKSFSGSNPLTPVFKALRSLGYLARQDFKCCQSCAWYEIPEEKSDKVVFYHRQDKQHLMQYGDCYLSWSGDGNEICYTLRSFGLTVEWDGSNSSRILVKNII
jgi:hypothetical protein